MDFIRDNMALCLAIPLIAVTIVAIRRGMTRLGPALALASALAVFSAFRSGGVHRLAGAATAQIQGLRDGTSRGFHRLLAGESAPTPPQARRPSPAQRQQRLARQRARLLNQRMLWGW